MKQIDLHFAPRPQTPETFMSADESLLYQAQVSRFMSYGFALKRAQRHARRKVWARRRKMTP